MKNNYISRKYKNGSYGILEKSTGHILLYEKNRTKSRNRVRFMNNGGGFDGFTPRFLCVDKDQDVNQERFVREEYNPTEMNESFRNKFN